MKTEPFTTQELHARIRNQLGFTQAETGDTVEQHGAAESFSEWLDKRSDSIPSSEAEAEEQRKIREFPTEDQLHVMAIGYDQCQIDGGE